jgi:hypothetical protein
VLATVRGPTARHEEMAGRTLDGDDGKETRWVLVTGATKFAEVRALLN